jgi:hypothetical protein
LRELLTVAREGGTQPEQQHGARRPVVVAVERAADLLGQRDQLARDVIGEARDVALLAEVEDGGRRAGNILWGKRK